MAHAIVSQLEMPLCAIAIFAAWVGLIWITGRVLGMTKINEDDEK